MSKIRFMLITIAVILLVSCSSKERYYGQKVKPLVLGPERKAVLGYQFAPEEVTEKYLSRPVTRIKKSGIPPKIDGRLDDETWRVATRFDFRINIGGRIPSEQTAAWMCFDSQNLYVAFECRESQIDKLKALVTEKDGPVWGDDCVEIFLDTNHDHTNYYHLIVNTKGTLYDAQVSKKHFEIPWDSNCEIATSKESDRWFVEMRIPAKDLNLECFRSGTLWGINLCREQVPKSEISCWAVTGGGFHRPERFGDVFFVGAELEQCKDIIIEDVSFGTEFWGNNEFSVSLSNRGDSYIKLTGELRYVDKDGKHQMTSKRIRLAPHASEILRFSYWLDKDEKLKFLLRNGKTHIKYFESVYKLHKPPGLIDFVPDNYMPLLINEPAKCSLALRISPHELKKGIVGSLVLELLRVGCTESLESLTITEFANRRIDLLMNTSELVDADYEIAARLLDRRGTKLAEERQTFMKRSMPIPLPKEIRDGTDGGCVQKDWSSGEFEMAEGVETEASPGEILLKQRLDKFMKAYRVTPYETITDMTLYHDRLYMTACTQPMREDTADIIWYDYRLDGFNKEFTANEQGLLRIHNFGDRLFVPGLDANDGTWDFGNMYLYDGKEWREKRTIPMAIHVLDLAQYHDNFYATISSYDPIKDTNEWKILFSEDEGDTWKEVFSSPWWVGYMAVFKDKLYVAVTRFPEIDKNGCLLVYNGSEWGYIDICPGYLEVNDLVVIGDNLLICGYPTSYFYDGKTPMVMNYPFFGKVRGVTKHGTSWFFAYTRSPIQPGIFYEDIEGSFVSGIFKSEDGKKWNLMPVFQTPPGTVITSLSSYHGRLFAGTHAKGELWVSGSDRSGFVISKPYLMDTCRKIILFFSASVPPATRLGFQFRIAQTRENLAKVSFVGPDGTDKSMYSNSGVTVSEDCKGQTWVQYKIILETEDQSKTPYLYSVAVKGKR